jgi:quercetin dioxygenase-like cupin family protein
MTYRIFDTSEIEGRRKPVAAELGARAIKVNQFDSQPGQAGREHDETESGQEEIYVPVRGTGVLRISGEEVAVEPGRFVLVPPEATRQVVAGDDGLSYVVIGAVVDD